MEWSVPPEENQSPEKKQESNNSSSQHSPQNVYPIENMNLDSLSPNPQSSENSKKNVNSNENSPPINYIIDNSAEEAKSNQEIGEDEEEVKRYKENSNELNLLIEKEGKSEILKGYNQGSYEEYQDEEEQEEEEEEQEEKEDNNPELYENQQNEIQDKEQNRDDLFRNLDKNQILGSTDKQGKQVKYEKQIMERELNNKRISEENKEEKNEFISNYDSQDLKEEEIKKRKQNLEPKEKETYGKSNVDVKNDNQTKNLLAKSNKIMQKEENDNKKEDAKANKIIQDSEKEFSNGKKGKLEDEEEKEDLKESQIDSPGKTKAKLRRLFMQYSDISDETGISRLNSRNFLKMLKDANLIDNNLTSCKVDIVYCECNSKKEKVFGFEQFLNSIIKLAEIKFYPEFNRQKEEYTMLLIRKYLIPLSEKYLSVDDTSKFNISNKDNNPVFSYDNNVKTILNSIYPILKEIYEIYFFHHMKKAKTNADLTKITPKLLVTFMREFEISPALINKQKALAFLDFIVKPDQEIEKYFNMSDIFIEIKYKNGTLVQMDCGIHFTLSRFFLFLTWTAVSVFEGLTFNVDYSVSEKLFFLLTKMELSKGFSNLTKSYSGSAGNKYSLIPPAQILADVL